MIQELIDLFGGSERSRLCAGGGPDLPGRETGDGTLIIPWTVIESVGDVLAVNQDDSTIIDVLRDAVLAITYTTGMHGDGSTLLPLAVAGIQETAGTVPANATPLQLAQGAVAGNGNADIAIGWTYFFPAGSKLGAFASAHTSGDVDTYTFEGTSTFIWIQEL